MAAKKKSNEEFDDGLLYSKLMSGFTKTMSKVPGSVINNPAQPDVMYPTGFLSLDYLNGQIIHVKSDEMDMTYEAIGIMDGTSNTFISRPGTGKSTFCVQTIGYMMKKYPLAMCFVDDPEGSLPYDRKEYLFDLPEEDFNKRIKIRNTGITTENVYKQIRAIYDEKVNNKKDFMYDTGLYDHYGNRIFKLYPTFYFIDSLAQLLPDDIMESEELDGGMGATHAAKKNTQLIKKISQLLKEANIVMFVINHIMDDVQTGKFKKQAQIDGLKDGERISGGKNALYLANNMIRFDQSSTLKPTEGFYIHGSIIDATIVKTRTNINKRKVPLVFNKSIGKFDNELSLFQLLKTEGRIGGAGAYLYLENCPDIKFAQKNFKEKLHENIELQKSFAILCKEVLRSYLSNNKNDNDENKFDINDLILGLDQTA